MFESRETRDKTSSLGHYFFGEFVLRISNLMKVDLIPHMLEENSQTYGARI